MSEELTSAAVSGLSRTQHKESLKSKLTYSSQSSFSKNDQLASQCRTGSTMKYSNSPRSEHSNKVKPTVSRKSSAEKLSLSRCSDKVNKFSRSNIMVHPASKAAVPPSNILSEGRKALKAFTELRQSAASLYPSTSKTSVFLRESTSSEEFVQTSNSPYIHMLMSSPSDIPKIKHQQTFVDSIFDKKCDSRKGLIHRQLKQHASYPVVYPTVEDDSGSGFANSNNDLLHQEAYEHNKFRKGTPTPVEERIKELCNELRGKNSDISTLKNEMKSLRATVEESSKEANIAKKLLQSFRLKVSSLEDQIDNLEERLNSQEIDIINNLMTKLEDGSPPRVSSSESLEIAVEEKEVKSQVLSSINFDKILTNIGDLNRRMDKMQSMQLIYTKDKSGATFKLPNPVALELYKNGIILGESGFRNYTVDSAKQVLVDICKGYFPSELYTQHPQGIFINVTDKRAVEYKENEAFSGCGCKLSGIDDSNIPKLMTVAKRGPSNAPSKEIVNSSESSLTNKHVYEKIESPRSPAKQLRNIQSDKMIILKLRDVDTDKGYKMCVSVWNTIEDIVSHLEKSINVNTSKVDSGNPIESPCSQRHVIDLISSVPFGVLSMLHATLKEYGVDQNTLLYIRMRSQQQPY